MRRLFVSFSFMLWSAVAQAGVTCTLPFTLTNNTTADATQVMANYNALVTCLTSAAQAGANSDITSLSGLTTPLSVAQGGTSTFIGGTSTGSANAQVVATTSPTSFALTAGYKLTFIAGFTNTGALTLNANSTGATAVFRQTQLGPVAMAGSEIIAGDVVQVIFDGTRYQIISIGRQYVGELKDWAGLTAPAGYLFADGSCQSRTTYASLFAVISTTYDPTGSTCDVNHFALPDGRGRLFAGRDDMGGSAASRITNAGSGCVGTTLGGAGCGAQNRSILQANLPNYTLPNTLGWAQDTGTFVGQNISQYAAGAEPQAGNFSGGTQTVTVTGHITGSVTSGGSGTALTTLNPLQVVNKIIKY